jgi:hypothetical protein
MKCLRKIWKKHFGRSNVRGDHDRPTREEIVRKWMRLRARARVTDAEIERWMKPSGKKKPRAK